MEIATRHFVRPEYMNHHNSLYAGYISEWITEAAFIGMAKVMGHTSHFVLAAVRGINVTRPVYTGSILELGYEVKYIGSTSVELAVEGRDFLSGDMHCGGCVVFVNVDDEGKKAPHGLERLPGVSALER